MADDISLTRRESEIMALLAEGLSNDEIARRLTISPNTVKVHVRNIFEKMQVQSRTEATMEAVRRGWIEVPGLEPVQNDGPEPPSWPPLEASWRRWHSLVLAMILLVALLLFFAPRRSPAPPIAGAPDFTSDRNAPKITLPPRQDVARWSQRSAMPTARSRAAGGLIDGRFYVVGGETAAGDSDVMEVYDPTFDVWTSLPPRPVAARGAAGAVLDATLYVAGGCRGDEALSDVHRYDPQTKQWTSVAALPEPRCGLALAALDGLLYAVGGWDGSHVVDTLFIYDPTVDRWEEGRRLPEPRAFLGAVPLQARLYVIGGRDGVQQRRQMWIYDPGSDAWEHAPDLPGPRAGLAVAAEGTSVYVVGGGEGNQPPLHERFDLLTQTWSTFDSPHSGPWRHAVAVMIGPNLYIIGGWGGDYLSSNEAYKASDLIFLPGIQGS